MESGTLLAITVIALMILPYEAAILMKFRALNRRLREMHRVHNIRKLVTELERLENRNRRK